MLKVARSGVGRREKRSSQQKPEAGHTSDDAGESVLLERRFNDGVAVDELGIEVENGLGEAVKVERIRLHPNQIGAELVDQQRQARLTLTAARQRRRDPMAAVKGPPCAATDTTEPERLAIAHTLGAVNETFLLPSGATIFKTPPSRKS